jgi:hypothetical protein
MVIAQDLGTSGDPDEAGRRRSRRIESSSFRWFLSGVAKSDQSSSAQSSQAACHFSSTGSRREKPRGGKGLLIQMGDAKLFAEDSRC